MAFNLVHPAGQGSSHGDIRYGQEVTTTPSPSIRPAYLITAPTPGTLPLGLDHIKPFQCAVSPLQRQRSGIFIIQILSIENPSMLLRPDEMR